MLKLLFIYMLQTTFYVVVVVMVVVVLVMVMVVVEMVAVHYGKKSTKCVNF